MTGETSPQSREFIEKAALSGHTEVKLAQLAVEKAAAPSVREYALLYAMNRERLARAKNDLLVLAPGPINRGVEVTPDVADGPHSAILEQVTNGLAVRMAVLWLLCGRTE